MRVLKTLVTAGTALALVVVQQSMAIATHETVQTVDPDGGADDVIVGTDTDGIATMVWTSRGELRYAMRLPNGKFGTPVPIPGQGLVGEVAFAESSNGNAIVAWTDLSEDGDVRASVNIGGKGFSAGRIVSAPMGSNNPNTPDVAISDSGRGVVVWAQSGADPGSINATLFSGSTFAASTALITDSAAGDPRVGMDGSGAALAVWDYDTQSDDRIQGAAAPAGGGFAAPVTIEQLQQGAGTPEVAVNQSGDAVIAYEDGVGNDCPVSSCSLFRVEAKYGSVNGTFGAVQTTPINSESGYGPGQHEVAIDDSGKAALLLSANLSGDAQVLARVSDDAGTFGAVQTLSTADAVTGPTIGSSGMDIDAGGGEFTAVWLNDHNGDGQENEVYRSSTTGGTFGEVHQLSALDDDSPDDVSVARDDSGGTVTGWVLFTDQLVPQASPVGNQAALTEGTETADNLKGSAGADIAHLEGGNDKFNGAGGGDAIYGGAGTDVLNGAAGNDKLFGEAGNDKLIGGPGTDVMNGGPGRDVCTGTKKEKRLASSCDKWVPITV